MKRRGGWRNGGGIGDDNETACMATSEREDTIVLWAGTMWACRNFHSRDTLIFSYENRAGAMRLEYVLCDTSCVVVTPLAS